MTAIVTIRINCDGTCGNFRVLETDSRTTARRMLAKLGWRVVLKHSGAAGGTTYGDVCPECPLEHRREAWRYAEHAKAPQKRTAAGVIGNALPRRTVKVQKREKTS